MKTFRRILCFIVGNYEPLAMDSLPQLWVAYLGDPSDSGKIHSDVSVRWHKGDADVINGMKKFAELTDQAKYVFFWNSLIFHRNSQKVLGFD